MGSCCAHDGSVSSLACGADAEIARKAPGRTGVNLAMKPQCGEALPCISASTAAAGALMTHSVGPRVALFGISASSRITAANRTRQISCSWCVGPAFEPSPCHSRLFAGILRAGQGAAAVMSLVHSARLNGHDPYAYLRDMPEPLPRSPPAASAGCCRTAGEDRPPGAIDAPRASNQAAYSVGGR